VKVLVNPSAGRGSRRLASLRRARPDVEWIESDSAAHFGALVREALHGSTRVAIAGGDGTVALAAAALDGPNRAPLAILPAGSGNDFAHDLGVPRALDAALALAEAGRPRWVDLARAGARRFCCVASVGLDELALPIVHRARRRSKLLNVWAALRALVAYRPRVVRVAWDGGAFEGPIMFVAVTNTRSYAGGFRVSPAAQLDDGALDLCIVRASGKARLVGNFPRILRGTHGALPEVILARSAWVRLDADEPLPVALDGELPVDTTPIELRCEPAALQVIA
jgi:diacylglycerol kinase (ATP)